MPAFDPQIAADRAWQGGRVGFALVGDAASPSCSQTKYSEGDLGIQATAFNGAWVTALMYPSSVMPGASYLAFEDLPMCANDWKCKGADGDFNDAVFFIAPKPCAGADAGVEVDAARRDDGSAGRDGSADGGAPRDAAVDRAATGGTAGAAGAGGVPGSGGVSSSGGTGGAGGQTSATGGQVSTGGSAGSPSRNPTGSGGCGCQSADGSAAGLLRWLILVALAGLRRRPKRPQITRP